MPISTKYITGLNPRQQEAVCQTEGPVLVLAGAGSGKTRVLTQRIAHIIANRFAKPSQILAVTFTNKAAMEMKERVGKLVGKTKASEVVISTFHSFCLKVLRKHIASIGYRKNFTISGEGDVRSLVRRVLDDIQGPDETFSPAMFLAEISGCKNSNKFPDDKKPEAITDSNKQKYLEWLPEVYDLYQSALRASNALDFDDLLLLTLKLWKERPEILEIFRKHFKYVMVDEYQDTNGVQYALLHMLVKNHQNFFVVGDDDQSIYSWRGADVSNILNFERDFRNTKVVTLDQNYRSTATILKAANSVIENNSKRREKNLWSDLGKGRPIDWIVVGDDEAEAKTVVKWLKHIQSRTGAKYSDFAILYRSNIQSRPIEIEFRQAEIPYVVIGGQDFFERAEVKDIIAYLKVIVNPNDEAACLRVINMPRRGIGDVTLHQVHELCAEKSISFAKGVAEILRNGQAPRQAEGGIREFLGLLQEYRKRFRDRSKSLKDIVSDLVAHIGYYKELDRVCKNGQQLMNRWANVEAVINAVGNYEESAENPTLGQFLDQSSLNKDENISKEERRKTGVTLMTIHSAKGLEFPFVFIAGIEEGTLPHEKSLRDDSLEEERRLFYVALTRGKRHVSMFESLSRIRHGKERMTKTSRFIKEIPEELLNIRVLAARDMVQESVEPPKPKRKRRRRQAIKRP